MPSEIRHRRLLPFLIAGLATIGPFAIDTYLPSFPAMALEMQTTEVLMQQTLTAYLIPFAVMMLFHGAISDAFGRRPVILIGVGGFVLASIGCALAPNMHVLLICRALQGLVAGAGTSLSRAVVRDAYQGVEAQRLMSRVMLMFSLAPAVAPIIGAGCKRGLAGGRISGFSRPLARCCWWRVTAICRKRIPCRRARALPPGRYWRRTGWLHSIRAFCCWRA